jgi:hypothetical protein
MQQMEGLLPPPRSPVNQLGQFVLVGMPLFIV